MAAPAYKHGRGKDYDMRANGITRAASCSVLSEAKQQQQQQQQQQ
jgi:hypothetical protein